MLGKKNMRRISASGAVLSCLAFCGTSSAQVQTQTSYPFKASPPRHIQNDLPVEVKQQQYYNNSGTVGRMGLGADPFHPEGPGNYSSPSR